MFAVGGGDFCEIAVGVVFVIGGTVEDVVFGGDDLVVDVVGVGLVEAVVADTEDLMETREGGIVLVGQAEILFGDGGLLVCGGEGGVGFSGGLVPGGVGVGGDDLLDLEVGVVEDEGFFRAVGGKVDDCGEAVFGFVGVDGVVLEDAGFELFFPAEAG